MRSAKSRLVPAPATASRTVAARSRSSASMSREVCGHGGREHDECRGDVVGRAADAGDGGVGAEVGDPPAAVAQGDSEGDEAEGVKFSRRAGEQRDRSGAAVRAAQQRKQSCFEQPAGEVLLADVDFGASPAFAEVVEERQDDVADGVVGAVLGEEPVDAARGRGSRRTRSALRRGRGAGTRRWRLRSRALRRRPRVSLGRLRRLTGRRRAGLASRARAARRRGSKGGTHRPSASVAGAGSGAPTRAGGPR